MVKAHTPINWENEPSYNTPLNAANLNKMDSEIGILDDRIIEQDTSKLDKSTAYTMVKDISFNDNNGVFTVTRLNGSTFTIDTKLEKISINFDYNKETQQIEIIFVDGTKEYIDISSLISPIDFVDSDTIGWEVTSDWKVKTKVLNGSITEDMLQPNYLAEIKVESAKAETNAIKSQSYAVGGTASRQNEDIDNARYYYEQAKSISESFSGALVPMGTVSFEDLPLLEDAVSGWMYNISNEFVTTDDFKEGAGYTVPLGANVFKTFDGFWDVLAGSPVTGVKGNSETSYRRGNVNITPENVGALAIDGDSQNNTVTFTSNDVADGSATSWTSVSALSSGITHATFFQRVSQMFKNVRYLYKMLGTTDISSIGNGTVTNAISTLNSNLNKKKSTILYSNTLLIDVGTSLLLSDKVINYDEIHIHLFACVNNDSETSRKFTLIDNLAYMGADKGWENRMINGGIYYNSSYNASVGLSINTDGTALIVQEMQCVGYSFIMGALIIGINY